MMVEIRRIKEFINGSRFLDETYFVVLSVVLAFGILQTMGTGLGTEKPVVTVISTSMCPALQVGDILLVESTDFSEVEERDIIVYNVPDRIEFEVNGEPFVLEANSTDSTPSVRTPLGMVELVDVRPSQTGDAVHLRLNGETVRVDGERALLEEGETYQLGNGTLSVNYLADLPYGNVPVVHRVVRKTDGYVETMGDNNPSQLDFEQRVEPDQIHGTVFFEVPRIGLVKILAMDFIGFSGDQPFVFDATPMCPTA
jgi:signal peptidase I